MARFLIHFLAPVPLALLGLLGYGMLAGGRVPSLADLRGFLGLGLVGGYTSMGLQSAVFAVVMLWLERRGVARAGRHIVAATVGGLFGATMAFAEDELPSSLTLSFGFLGAVVGPATVVLADLVGASSQAAGRHQRVGESAPEACRQATWRNTSQ